MPTALKTLRSYVPAQITLALFLALTVWWLYLFVNGIKNQPQDDLFGFIYGGFSLWGGVWGLIIAQKWGGAKSIIGKAILCLSIGLFFQAFGQYSFFYYNYVLKVDVPYPSISDIGYFGTIPFYIYAVILLAKSSGAKISLNTITSRAQVILIPLVMLLIAYYLFFRNYSFDPTTPLATFLNYGYPFGQAIYISIAILTYSLSRRTLGGVMRFPLLFLIGAFFAQFLADYVFIYFHDLYYPASFMDYLYLVAYFMMSLGLIQLNVVIDHLQQT